MEQKLIFTNIVGEAIDDLVASLDTPQVIVITDVNTAQFVLPVLTADSSAVRDARLIKVNSGEHYKTLDELSKIWEGLQENNATRQTVIINVGGGVISDMGGFAASTFKRGLRFINVPTTLLSAVDASVGGKTGINFNGYKNQIGVFSEPEAAIISTCYFNTLPAQELLSGYAEMIKHSLLEGKEMFDKLMKYSVQYPMFDSEALFPLLQQSVELKARIVEQDPTETGTRKVLNLGHTIAHAFETLGYNRKSPIPHGYAVAWGLVVEMILSNMLYGFSSEELHNFAAYVLKNYNAYDITCDDYPALLDAMKQDKKNAKPEEVTFTLLKDFGEPEINVVVKPEQITAALDIYRDLMHLA